MVARCVSVSDAAKTMPETVKRVGKPGRTEIAAVGQKARTKHNAAGRLGEIGAVRFRAARRPKKPSAWPEEADIAGGMAGGAETALLPNPRCPAPP